MADIFREIDDSLRKERFEKIWDKHKILIIVGGVALLMAIGGYNFLTYQKEQARGQAMERFFAATSSAESPEKMTKALEELIRAEDKTTLPALFQLASEQLARGEKEKAVETLGKVKKPAFYKGWAAIRMAMILLPEKPQQAVEILEDWRRKEGAHQPFALYISALARLQAENNNQNRTEALSWVERAATAPHLTPAFRQHLEQIRALLATTESG